MKSDRHLGPSHFRGGLLQQTATFLGLTANDLAQALRNGATPGDIAVDAGSSVEALAAHLQGVVSVCIQEASNLGEIDAARAEELLAGVGQWVQQRVAESPAAREGDGRTADRPGRDRHGARADEPFAASTSASVCPVCTSISGCCRWRPKQSGSAWKISRSADAVISVLLTDVHEGLDTAVEAGRLGAKEAALKLGEARTNITERVNSPITFSEQTARPISERRALMSDSTG